MEWRTSADCDLTVGLIRAKRGLFCWGYRCLHSPVSSSRQSEVGEQCENMTGRRDYKISLHLLVFSVASHCYSALPASKSRALLEQSSQCQPLFFHLDVECVLGVNGLNEGWGASTFPAKTVNQAPYALPPILPAPIF